MTFSQRVLAPKPLFFQRLQRRALVLALLCLGILLFAPYLPAVVQVAAGCGYAASLSAAAVSQLTTGGKTHQSNTHGRFLAKHS